MVWPVKRFRASPEVLGIALAVIGVLARLAARSRELEGWDGADFALALRELDLAKQQPHFPGYPVYVALARLVEPFAGRGVAAALTLPGAIVGGAAAWAVARLGGGWAAALLYVAAPGLWLIGGKPMSDGLGLGLLLFAFATARDRPALSGVLAGLVLGARLSYAPALLPWAFVVRGQWRRAAAGLSAGVLVWLLPLVWSAGGPVRLVEIGARFVGGHFDRWGGAAGYLEPLERVRRMLWGLCDFSLGTIGPGDFTLPRVVTTVALAGALVVGVVRSRSARLVLLASLPYLVWVALGQNPDRPRHLAPIAVALVLAAGPARAWCAVAAAGMLATAVPLVREQARVVSPDTALVLEVARTSPHARFYGWDTVRLFDVYAPAVDARRVRSLDDLARLEQRSPAQEVLFTSDLEDKRHAQHCIVHVRTFRADPHLFPPRRALTLLRWCGPTPRPTRPGSSTR